MNRSRSSTFALAVLILFEVVLFGLIGTNFLGSENGFEILRLSVEIGLLAVALTPVIVAGGIDLSVGSLMGLSAVIFGKLWRDAGMPIPFVAALTLGFGAGFGALNGLLITRLRIPPLIVTLGTASLARGMAEGLTGAVDNFTNFPVSFLQLGQGYLGGVLPAQLPVFALVALITWLGLHRTTLGRGLFAIGNSPEGARHAALPVDRMILVTYVWSGMVAALAAVVYVSHLGQAKADAGMGYELFAITAVVLGGTSIFGGRGSVAGTLLGLLAIAVLQNGVRLADYPAELAGILTGLSLLAAIGLDRVAVPTPAERVDTSSPERFVVKNSQVAVLGAMILLAALIVAGSNVYMARSLVEGRPTDGTAAPPAIDPSTAPDVSTPRSERITVAMMPKSKGNAYFISCRQGAEKAAAELNVELIWDGPTDTDPARQNQIIDTWITRGVDVIAVAVENRDGVASVLRKARDRGIKVITWDADATPDARDFFVNQATPEGIGRTLMDHAARILGEEGKFAIITASLTAGNMIEWQKQIEARRIDKYPNVEMASLRPCDDLYRKAYDEANTILNAEPDVRLIMAICTPAVPAAAEAVKQSGRTDVKVIGLGLPNANKAYVHEGITEAVILWKTVDLGYLAVRAARAVHDGDLKPGDTTLDGGPVGVVTIQGDNILLGEPFTFDRTNIDQFDF